MERAAFLDRVRRRLDLGFPPDGAHPLRPVDGVPAVHYEHPATDLVAALTEAVEANGGIGRIVTDAAGIDAVIDEFVRDAGTAAVSRDPAAVAIVSRLRERGIRVIEPDTPQELADVPVGMTGTTGAIARTGTIVVDTGHAGSRTVSLIPATHVALVDARRIVPTPSEWWRRMPSWYPDGLPSQIVFVTGPSKSADIELNLTTGVHGPGRLVVVVLDGDALPTGPARGG